MGLDEKASFFLVRVAQIVASLDRFGEARIQVCGLSDAHAVRTMPAEIGQAVSNRAFEAVHRSGEHESEGIFPRPLRAGKNNRVRHPIVRQHLAQAMDGLRVAGTIRKGHKSARRWLLAVRRSLSAGARRTAKGE